MKKILQAFKKLFSKKAKEVVYYICDPEKAKKCPKGEQCWYIEHGPCKCTSHKSYAKTDKKGRPMIAHAMDIWNEEFREYCLEHPEILWKE